MALQYFIIQILDKINFNIITMEIDRKNLHWMMINKIPEQLLKRLEKYRLWLDQKLITPR
jgi:hypothetical protein